MAAENDPAEIYSSPEKLIFGMLATTKGNPAEVRRWLRFFSNLWIKRHGKEAADAIDAAFLKWVRDHGIDPSELLPRKAESREQLLKRIRSIGLAEVEAAAQARSYEEYRKVLNLIEQEVMEYASEEDSSFICARLTEHLWELEIYGKWEVLPTDSFSAK